EHNLDVNKTADWIIDLGPEGGDAGGRIVTCGPPEEVVDYAASQRQGDKGTRRQGEARPSSSPCLPLSLSPCPISHTGESLAPVLDGSYAAAMREAALALNGNARGKKNGSPKGYAELATHIVVRGAKQHNLTG